MIKLAVFDLDGTLAPIGCESDPDVVDRLRSLQDKGVKLAICSGKPVYYLCGFIRQTGLKDVILMGESGAVIQFGTDLPPAVHAVLPYDRNVKKALRIIQEDLENLYPDLWFQPNDVVVTPFPRDEQGFDHIQDYLDSHPELLKGIRVFKQVDCYDLVPEGLTKYDGLKKLSELTGIHAEEMAAIGDGINDIPMFRFASASIAINRPDCTEAGIHVRDIHEAMDVLFRNIEPVL